MAPIYLLFFAWLIRSGMKKKNKLKSYRYRSNAIVRLNAYFTFGNSIRKDAPNVGERIEQYSSSWDAAAAALLFSAVMCLCSLQPLIGAEYRSVRSCFLVQNGFRYVLWEKFPPKTGSVCAAAAAEGLVVLVPFTRQTKIVFMQYKRQSVSFVIFLHI